MQFAVVVPLFNDAAWIADSIARLKAQSHGDFRCLLIDDLSTDATPAVVQAAIEGDARFEFMRNVEKKFSLRNVADGIAHLDLADDDVVVLLDGDDRLAHDDVFSLLREVYRDDGCWITYGSYSDTEGKRDPSCVAYPAEVVRERSYRTAPWHASHLKTFRAHLWRCLDPEQLRVHPEELAAARRWALTRLRWRAHRAWQAIHLSELHEPSGRYVRRCVDKAMMFPLLELAGDHGRFVEPVLYHHRTSGKQANPYGSSTTAPRWMNRLIRWVLAHRSILPALKE